MSRRRKNVTADVEGDFSKFWDYWVDLNKTAAKLAGYADMEELPLPNKVMVAAYAAATWVARDGRDKKGGAE